MKESGITPERTELDAAVEQIITIEESADTELQETIDENKETLEADRRKAEDMRENAMETMGKTQKRKSEEGSSKAKKSRRSGSEAIEYLKERAVEDLKLKSQEIELKKQGKEQPPNSTNTDVSVHVRATAGTAEARKREYGTNVQNHD